MKPPRNAPSPAAPGSTGTNAWLRLRDAVAAPAGTRRPGLASRWKAADRVAITPLS